jgi:membrane protein YqaA with SNARE-associated domain
MTSPEWYMVFINSYGYPGLFVLEFLFTASILFALPADPLIAFAGALLDPLFVGAVAGLAASFGECVSYYFGKAGHATIEKKHEQKFLKIKKIFAKYGFWSLPLFALTPLPADLIGILAGCLEYDIKSFFIGMLIGKVPRALIIAYSGYYGFEITKLLFFT